MGLPRFVLSLLSVLAFSCGAVHADEDVRSNVAIDVSGFCGLWQLTGANFDDLKTCETVKPNDKETWYRGNCKALLTPNTYVFLSKGNLGPSPSFSIGRKGEVTVLGTDEGKLAIGDVGHFTLMTTTTQLDVGEFKGGFGYEYVGSGVDNDPTCRAPSRFILPAGFRYLTFPGAVRVHDFYGYIFSEQTDVWTQGYGIETLRLKTARVTVEPTIIATGAVAPIDWKISVYREIESLPEAIKQGTATVTEPQRLQLQFSKLGDNANGEKVEQLSGFFSLRDDCKPSVDHIELGDYSIKLSAVCD